MYEIITDSARVEKKINKLLDSLNETTRRRYLSRLRHNPFPTGEHNDIIEKIKGVYKLSPTKSDRIIYVVDKKGKYVLIRFAGNHDDYMDYLKEYIF